MMHSWFFLVMFEFIGPQWWTLVDLNTCILATSCESESLTSNMMSTNDVNIFEFNGKQCAHAALLLANIYNQSRFTRDLVLREIQTWLESDLSGASRSFSLSTSGFQGCGDYFLISDQWSNISCILRDCSTGFLVLFSFRTAYTLISEGLLVTLYSYCCQSVARWPCCAYVTPCHQDIQYSLP